MRHCPAPGTITLAWTVGTSCATFTVADGGPGIAPEELPHLFDPLYRGDVARSPETGGVGLGLSIARRILRAHGGDLTVTNGTDGGARFTGWLAASAEPTGAREASAAAVD